MSSLNTLCSKYLHPAESYNMTSENHRLRFFEDTLKEILPHISRKLDAMGLCLSDKSEITQIVRIYFFTNLGKIFSEYANGKGVTFVICYAKYIAKTRAINLLNKSKRHPVLDIKDMEHIASEDESDTPTQYVDTRKSTYEKYLKQLSPSQQDVLTLRQKGLINETIAETRGIAIGTVREHYSEGLKKMRRLVANTLE